ncbi:MAG: NfeD family protein [Alistipes sp.]
MVDQQGRRCRTSTRVSCAHNAVDGEAHGKVVERVDGTDTVWRWRRDPAIAEAMVGTTAGDSTTVGVLTLTADEALARHYSEGKAVSVAEVLSNAGVVDYTLYENNPTTLDRVLGWLMNPFAQGIFIMLIVGGIYFELQTPGVGFPLVAAVLGAVLYFSPLYLEGMVQNWEPILFVVGLLLIAVEIFVLPGFGIAGIAGIVAVVTGLAFAAIDNDVLRHVFSGELSAGRIVRPFLVVIVGSVAAFVAALYFGRRFLTGDSRFQWIDADDRPDSRTGLCRPSVAAGRPGRRTGTVTAVLRPSGKIVLDGIYYDPVAEIGLFIGRGEKERVVRDGTGLLYCKQDFSDPSES